MNPYVKMRLSNCGQKTKWLVFYIGWRFPIGFILGGLVLLGYINNLLLLDSSTTEEIYAFLVFIDICLYIYSGSRYI